MMQDMEDQTEQDPEMAQDQPQDDDAKMMTMLQDMMGMMTEMMAMMKGEPQGPAEKMQPQQAKSDFGYKMGAE